MWPRKAHHSDIWSFGCVVLQMLRYSQAVSLSLDADPKSGDTFLLPSNRATLTCRDYGNDNPIWQRRRTSYESFTDIPSTKIRLTQVEGTTVSQLVFDPIDAIDGGEYLCKQDDKNSATIWLNVADAASVIPRANSKLPTGGALLITDNTTEITLHCDQAFNPPFPLIWTHPNGTVIVSTTINNKGDQRAVIQSAAKGYALVVKGEFRAPSQLGTWKCSLNTTDNSTLPANIKAALDRVTVDIAVEARPDVKIEGAAHGKSKSATKGEPFQLKCIVQGHEGDNITWYFQPEPEDRDYSKVSNQLLRSDKSGSLPECKENYEWPAGEVSMVCRDDVFEDKSRNASEHPSKHRQDMITSILKFREMNDNNRGKYHCAATNGYGDTEAVAEVKVKDKWAALWPFLGIVAEVVILCLIIFIYEKRRNKAHDEEDETTEPMKADLNERDSQARNRKA